MTHSEAAELIAALHGAFPKTYFDDAVGEMFANSFVLDDYEASKQAVVHWVQTMDRFPTIAELRRDTRRIKGQNEPAALQAPVEERDIKKARDAFESGYRRARERAGDDPESIEQKLADRRTRPVDV